LYFLSKFVLYIWKAFQVQVSEDKRFCRILESSIKTYSCNPHHITTKASTSFAPNLWTSLSHTPKITFSLTQPFYFCFKCEFFYSSSFISNCIIQRQTKSSLTWRKQLWFESSFQFSRYFNNDVVFLFTFSLNSFQDWLVTWSFITTPFSQMWQSIARYTTSSNQQVPTHWSQIWSESQLYKGILFKK